ncbi:hypothetical protein ABZV64_00745 [Streptomyces sp. NPDC004959]|uniref:hypothetical protein n=1 Tax=unclassified Streptomyces TaxID=2593676 RepID=UPI000AA34BCA|nr:hypothetical protein [Streptomyces sp. NRRL F-5630]
MLEQCRQPRPKPERVSSELQTEDARLLWVDQDVFGREAYKSISSQSVLQYETASDAVGDVASG